MTSEDAIKFVENETFDIDTYCPAYDCDGNGADSDFCLGDDVLETLVQNGGVARGAKIAMFDWGHGPEPGPSIYLAGNYVWNSTFGTGAMIHSNSWGYETYCELTESEFLYDTFMYEVRIGIAW